jgi:hypothetical protein
MEANKKRRVLVIPYGVDNELNAFGDFTSLRVCQEGDLDNHTGPYKTHYVLSGPFVTKPISEEEYRKVCESIVFQHATVEQ